MYRNWKRKQIWFLISLKIEFDFVIKIGSIYPINCREKNKILALYLRLPCVLIWALKNIVLLSLFLLRT